MLAAKPSRCDRVSQAGGVSAYCKHFACPLWTFPATYSLGWAGQFKMCTRAVFAGRSRAKAEMEHTAFDRLGFSCQSCSPYKPTAKSTLMVE